MIPSFALNEWRQQAPWTTSAMVEQDLVIARALTELYNNPVVNATFAFRGRTALNKVFFKPAARYSEDIDLVQIKRVPIGAALTEIRQTLHPSLGDARWKKKPDSVKLYYQYTREDNSHLKSKLKFDINTVEQMPIYGLHNYPIHLNNSWFQGATNLVSYQLEEALGSKLRALYQRLKGRDLFDLWYAHQQLSINSNQVLNVFENYSQRNGVRITQKQFSENLRQKIMRKEFVQDVVPLLHPSINWKHQEAYELVMDTYAAKLPVRQVS